MKPFRKNKNRDLVYRFQITIHKINHVKLITYSYKPKLSTLTIDKANWIKFLSNQKIKTNKTTLELFDFYLSQKKGYAKKYRIMINIIRPIISNFNNITNIKKRLLSSI